MSAFDSMLMANATINDSSHSLFLASLNLDSKSWPTSQLSEPGPHACALVVGDWSWTTCFLLDALVGGKQVPTKSRTVESALCYEGRLDTE